MLVLTRKPGQEIWIDGRKIVVTVVSIDRGRVKIGIQADRDIPVKRGELPESPDQGTNTPEEPQK